MQIGIKSIQEIVHYGQGKFSLTKNTKFVVKQVILKKCPSTHWSRTGAFSLLRSRAILHVSYNPETACLVQWLARLSAIQAVPGSIPGYTLEIFLEV